MGVEVFVDVDTADAAGRTLIAPVGMATPHQRFVVASIEDLPVECTLATGTGQPVMMLTREAYAQHPRVRISYRFENGGTAYPDAIFAPMASRFTRAAAPLIEGVTELAEGSTSQRETIERVVAHTAEAFTYGHPPVRYYDGREDIPLLGCGVTEGSCVDINMYLIAALRSLGIEAGYVAGPFFPAEKHGHCDDMHCWVVTRAQGETLEWDIAHHLKLGTRSIAPGLNPKPGWRAALSWSMGWDIPALGVHALKLLSEPMWVDDAGKTTHARVSISSRGALQGALQAA